MRLTRAMTRVSCTQTRYARFSMGTLRHLASFFARDFSIVAAAAARASGLGDTPIDAGPLPHAARLASLSLMI